jgi:hypothetical protein
MPVLEATSSAIQWYATDGGALNAAITGTESGGDGILTVSTDRSNVYLKGFGTDTADNGCLATVGYVKDRLEEEHPKESCVVSSTDNQNVSNTSLAAGQTLDSRPLVAGDRILLLDQTNKAENGPWVVRTSAAPIRPDDFNASDEVPGASIWVTDGAREGYHYVVTTPVTAASFTLGTNDIVLTASQSGTYTAGNGLGLSGSEFSADLKVNGGLVIESGKIAMDLAASSITGQLAFSDLADLNSAQLLVGNGSNVATAVNVAGAVTISNAGVTSITAGAVVDADVNASAAIAFSKLASLSDGNILVGNGSGVATGVAMSGDVAIDNTGATTIQAGAVEASMIAPNAVGPAQLAHNTTDAGLIAFDGTGAPIHLDAGTTDYPLVSKGTSATPAFEQLSATAIADNAITLDKMEHGTSGDVLYYGASGAPARLPKGTDGEVLTLASGVPSWATANSTPADGSVTLAKLAPIEEGGIIVGTDGSDPAIVSHGAANTVLYSNGTTLAYGTITSAMITDATIVNADISAGAAITLNKLVAGSAAQIMVGAAGTGIPTYRAVTGDIALSATGVAAIASGAIVNADVNASAAIDFSKLATLTDGYLLVGNGSNVATGVAMSGDATIANTGAVTLAAAQTNVTSMYAADLAVGNASSEEKIIFDSADNEIEFYAENTLQNRVTNESGGKFYIRGSYQVFSDARIKGHLEDMDDTLDRIDAMECKRYRLKKRDGSFFPRYEIGQIAQTTFASCPELVTTTEGEGYSDLHTINYGGLAALATEGVKQLHAKHRIEVAALKAENASLRAALDALTARVAALE